MAEKNVSKDQERLAKLWDAYEVQEKEFELAMKKIATLENKIEEFSRVNNVLKKAVEARDTEVRELELKIIGFEDEIARFGPKQKELEESYKKEKDRYTKLFTITEELEEDLARAKRELEVKDKWFERNVGMLENIRESIIDRNVRLHEFDLDGFSETVKEGKGADTDTGEVAGAAESDTGEQKKDDEKITFNTVNVDIEKKEETYQIEEPSKTEMVAEFGNIPNIDLTIAEKLYDAGFTNMDKLKNTTTEEIVKLEAISPTLARKISTSISEMQ